MRLRPARILSFLTLASLAALAACSDDSPVRPAPPGSPVWAEISNFPAPVTLYGVWAPRSNYMIGVGRGGRIWQWDGSQWMELPHLYPDDLHAIDGSTAGDVIAVGEGGTVLQQQGSQFLRRDAGVSDNLHDVWRSPSGEFFVVGDRGIILRGSGSAWSLDSTTTNTATLLSVWGSSDTDVFAAGVDGVILHYDGAAWSSMASGTSQVLASIDGTAANNVYAAGAAGTLLHFDGTQWGTVQSRTTDVLQSVCAACGPAAAGANGTVVQGNNGAFTRQKVAGAPWLYAIARAGEDEWAFGSNTIVSYDGKRWIPDTRGTVPVLRALTSNAALGLVVTGDNGIAMTGGMSRWNLEDAGAVLRLNAVYTTPGGDVFAAGTNRIFHRTGQGWTVENSQPVEYYDLGGNSDHLFAVGGSATILERIGSSWTSVVTGANSNFHAICINDSGGYIAGTNGNILYYENNTWTVKYTNANATLWDVAFVQTQQYRAVAVGTNGLCLGRSTVGGAGWSTVQTPVTTTLYALARGPGGGLYAAGSGGTLLEFVGEKWNLVPTPTTRPFLDAWERDGALFLCGGSDPGGGMLFRYGPPAP